MVEHLPKVLKSEEKATPPYLQFILYMMCVKCDNMLDIIQGLFHDPG